MTVCILYIYMCVCDTLHCTYIQVRCTWQIWGSRYKFKKKKLFCDTVKPTLLTPLHRHSSEECLPPCQSAGRSTCMVLYYLYNRGNGAVSGANVWMWAAVLCTKPTQDLYWDIVRSDGIRGHSSQVTTACCVSYVYILLVAISATATLSHLSSRYLLCLGSRLVWFAARGARTKRGWTEHGTTAWPERRAGGN